MLLSWSWVTLSLRQQPSFTQIITITTLQQLQWTLYLPTYGDAVALLVRHRTCDWQVAGSSHNWEPLCSGLQQATPHTCVPITKQYNLVLTKGVLFGWESNLVESKGSLPLSHLWADCQETGISSVLNARKPVREYFTYLAQAWLISTHFTAVRNKTTKWNEMTHVITIKTTQSLWSSVQA